jgi:hypothetical protein
MQVPFFTCHDRLVDMECQNRITEYQFCKKFSCPPYKDMQTTPARLVDDFMIIDQEFNQCQEKQNNKGNEDA